MSKDVTTKARIFSKPEVQFTEASRLNQVTGKIVLVAVLSADGTVRGIVPIKSLPFGLTEKAIEAARGIKFTPALINNQPVSVFIQIEYNFNLY